MRFFAFGCSFTKYHWPTWADILGRSFKTSFNLGKEGAGNGYIFHSLVDTIVKQSINSNDIVVVQWTNFARKDQFDNGWRHSGNDWSMDLEQAYKETSGIIASATHLLDAIGCRYVFTSMMPIGWLNNNDPMFDDIDMSQVNEKYKVYHDTVKTSMVEYLFDSLPVCRNPEPILVNGIADNHPTPVQHLRYAKDILAKTLNINISDETKSWIDKFNG